MGEGPGCRLQQVGMVSIRLGERKQPQIPIRREMRCALAPTWSRGHPTDHVSRTLERGCAGSSVFFCSGNRCKNTGLVVTKLHPKLSFLLLSQEGYLPPCAK